MACLDNNPSFGYIAVRNLVITYNGVPYAIANMYTNKKYVIWNKDNPNVLTDSHTRPNSSLTEFLIAINDKGISTMMPHDELTYSFDRLTSNNNPADYESIKEQVNENTKKYNIVIKDVNGLTNIIGSTEESDEGSILYNLFKLQQTSESFGVQLEEIKSEVADKFKDLRPGLIQSLINYLTSVSEFKLSYTTINEDTIVTEEQLQAMETCKTNMINESNSLNSKLDSLITILKENNDESNVTIVEGMKTQITTLMNKLIAACDNALLNNKIDGDDKTNIIIASANLANYIGVVQNTCDNIMVNGLGGVIYKVKNDFIMYKDKTENNITELNRNDDDLFEKYTSVKQTTDSIVEEVGGLKTSVGDLTNTSKKNVRSVTTYYCLSSSPTELIGTDFANVQKGDLIFQGLKDNGRYKGVYHVGIYYGLDDKGVPRILECTGNNIVKLHSDNKTMGIVLSDWNKRKKSDIVCIARPHSSASNRVFAKADEFLTFAKTYYDKRDKYITYGNINIMSDNSTRLWNEVTCAGKDSPDGLYRFLDCSSYLNVVIRGIPFEEIFANETVYNSKNLTARTNFTWTKELPRYAAEQCEEVESLGWAMSPAEWHTNGNQWVKEIPENTNNYYIWSKNVTTYKDGTTTESEINCISNEYAQDGKSIQNIIPYYYESTSGTELIDGYWTTISPTWSNDKYVWTKNLISYNDDSTIWTDATCVSGTSPMTLELQSSSYVVAFDSFNIPKSNDNITLTAKQTNFNDAINWFVSPNTITLGGSGSVKTLSPSVFSNLDKVTITIQSGNLSNTIAIVKVKDGQKGQDGTSVKILDSYNSEEELNAAHPDGNENGDGYLINGDLYIWDGAQFKNVGRFQGDNGENGKTPYVHIKYSNDGGLTFTPNNGEDVGTYIGMCVDYEVSDPSNVSSYKWSQFQGDKGDKGDNGVGVESIVIEYAKNQSKTSAPTTGWSTSIPVFVKGYYLWYRTRTKYTNNSNYTYSIPTCDESWKSVGDILDIIGDWTNTETISESFSKVTKTMESISQEVKRNSRVGSFRYIRDYLKGNTVNSAAHYVELQVFKDNTNVALNKTVTCSGTGVNLPYVTNGDISSSQYAEVTGGQLVTEDDLNGYKYIQVDLGSVVSNIEKIKVWHYYSDARAYYHKLEVSKDGNEWFRIFDSDKSGLYNENSKGKTYIIDDTYSETKFEQTADKFNWFIKSGTSASNMVLTDRVYALTTERAMISAKTIELNGSININNGTFKVDTNGNMTCNSGTFKGAITGGTININNNFKVTSGGSMTATGADISGKVTITDGSIDLNGGLFKVFSNGNTKIGGLCTHKNDDGTDRGVFEITSSGTMYSRHKTDSKVYTYITEGKLYQRSYDGTASLENGQLKVSDGSTSTYYGDGYIGHNLSIMVETPRLNCTQKVTATEFTSSTHAILRAELNSSTNGEGGAVYLCCNGASASDGGARVIKNFKNSDGNYVLRSESTAGTVYLGTATYPWKEVIAKTLTQTSDRTLKENITYLSNTISTYSLNNDISIYDCYDFVNNDLPIVTYNYIDDNAKKIGFIAQDLLYNADESNNKIGQLIVNPKSYTKENGKLTYDLSNYVSVLAGALQVAIRKIDDLEKRLEVR